MLAAVVLAGAGCAGIRVYTDPALKSETGIKVFSPKPYLLVSRTGAKDKPIELSIVYLPNTTDALYVKQQRGWGSSEMSVKVNNGILTDFGTKSDSKIPESLTAMGSLLTAAAGAFKTVQEGIQVRDEAASRAELDKAAARLRNAAADIAGATQAATFISSNQKTDGAEIAKALSEAADTISDPTQIDNLEATADALEGLIKRIETLKVPGAAEAPATTYNFKIDTVRAEVAAVIDAIRPKTPKPATFELYEIVQTEGQTRLIPVKVGL